MPRAALTLTVLLFLILALAAQLLWLAPSARLVAAPDQARRRLLVQQLGLTDLALWTEARYTRHPSQADLFTAFQDGPAALDHFPAGSILAPVTPQVSTRLQFQKNTGPR